MTHSEEHGDPERLAVLQHHPSLWIHGAGLSGSTWREMTRDLPNAQTPDLPGHGAAAPLSPPRVEAFAEALLRETPRGCILIGHSLGGMVALEMATRAPSRIAALILVEAVPTVRDSLLKRWSASVAAWMLSNLPLKAVAWLSGIGQPAATREEVRAQLMRHSRVSLSAALDAALHYDDRTRLARITVPTLVITGRDNRATHRGAALIAEQVPNATAVMLPGGHMLHWDNPVALRREIDGFLQQRLR
ncbi:alpha/beta fold hydrolase [uncultured Roseobacter sp.]|uniref:alpha/beta fold hydrolase n=1 Tax=uncultured Roseobacter sp. TaxID=114847 RepID=UPI00261A18F2|nr:alpha/beta fold hydrolase [uncultured Roseobacter sp.]